MLPACGDSDDAAVVVREPVAPLSDGQITGVLVSANEDAIVAAPVASDRGGPESRDYAAQGMAEHTAALDRIRALGIPVVSSDIGLALDLETKRVIAQIGKAQTTVAVDLLYLCWQVRAQTAVLALANVQLETGTVSLETEVDETRRVASEHLAIAAARAIDVAAVAAGGLRASTVTDVCGAYGGPLPGNGTGVPANH
jgi:hypothetical protein